MSDTSSIVGGLVDYLRYQKECGLHTLELDPASLATLAGLKSAATAPPAAAPASAPEPLPPRVAPPRAAALPAGKPAAALERTAAAVAACRRCGLHAGRTQVVPGQGNPVTPDILFIGEAPGADEDRQGLAFVGRAGQLLTKMIVAMGYAREDVFIANICKCRPPNNRPPTPDEMAACLPFLKEQIRILRPRTIVAMGNTAILGLLGQAGISRLRGIWTTFEGIPLMPTYHPAYLLRFPTVKRDAWNDLKKVLKHLGRPVPAPAPKAKPD